MDRLTAGLSVTVSIFSHSFRFSSHQGFTERGTTWYHLNKNHPIRARIHLYFSFVHCISLSPAGCQGFGSERVIRKVHSGKPWMPFISDLSGTLAFLLCYASLLLLDSYLKNICSVFYKFKECMQSAIWSMWIDLCGLYSDVFRPLSLFVSAWWGFFVCSTITQLKRCIQNWAWE